MKTEAELQAMPPHIRMQYARLIGALCDYRLRTECKRLRFPYPEALKAPLATIGHEQECEKLRRAA